MSTKKVQEFVMSWISRNVHATPGIDDSVQFDARIARLWQRLASDAAHEDITVPQLEAALGDVEEYLADEIADAKARELGIKH